MLSNSVASFPNFGTRAVCTLCGLMCDLGTPAAGRCTRLTRWKEAVPSPRREAFATDIATRLARTKLNADTLIWLDACDVQTARAAIQLAQKVGATVHVGQSTGSHAVKSVMASDGWLGSTLSELSARAELIVTLGDGVRREAPLLADRFFQSRTRTQQPHWIHISQQARVDCSSMQASVDENVDTPDEEIHWPRDQWFEGMSQLALSLLQPTSKVSATAQAVAHMSTQLLASSQTVWVWDVDELHFQTDELVVRRMLSIARTLSERGRCALLPLDLNIGRVTAEETLLWLTGCPTTATWSGKHWYRSPRFGGYSLEQWSSAFSSIVLVSNLASDRVLPNLPADLTIQTAPICQENQFQVAAVGQDCSGHLFRGDRGTVFYVKATSSSDLPTAAELLEQLTEAGVAN